MHTESVHEKKKSLKCERCDAYFAQEIEFRQHVDTC